MKANKTCKFAESSSFFGLGAITKKEQFLNGDCDVFAYALSRKKHLRVYVLLEDRIVDGVVKSGLVHAFCIPNTTDKELDYAFEEIVDAAGLRGFKEMLLEYSYEGCPKFIIKALDTPADVLDYAGYRDLRQSELKAKLEAAFEYLDGFDLGL